MPPRKRLPGMLLYDFVTGQIQANIPCGGGGGREGDQARNPPPKGYKPAKGQTEKDRVTLLYTKGEVTYQT
jgi:hypothetical protein